MIILILSLVTYAVWSRSRCGFTNELPGPCDLNWSDDDNAQTKAERVYYIACVEEEWDYAPSGFDKISGEEITSNSHAGKWLYGNGINRIGSKYIKTRYIEYTNNCFTERQHGSKFYDHLGAIGPVIRAIVGETIKVYYKNMCNIPSSIHPHGLFYEKQSEGISAVVEPDNQWIYIWKARKSNVDRGTSSKMWLYHSHIDEIKDIHSGLIGPIIITQKDKAIDCTNLMPLDLSREFVTFFVLYDENESLMFNKNIQKLNNPDLDIDDPDFVESNLMHSINGYLFGNLDTLTCTGDEDVRWYTASFGNELDGPHSPHWHGNVATTTYGENTDTVVLIAGATSTVTMKIDSLGQWLYHCHVFDHIDAGMITTYTAEANTNDNDHDNSVIDNKIRVNDLCINIKDGEYQTNGASVTMDKCEDNSFLSQSWEYNSITKEIVNGGGKCLEIRSNDYDLRLIGGILQIWDCNGKDNQKWIIDDNFIKSTNGLCVGISGTFKIEDGSIVRVWSCADDD